MVVVVVGAVVVVVVVVVVPPPHVIRGPQESTVCETGGGFGPTDPMAVGNAAGRESDTVK